MTTESNAVPASLTIRPLQVADEAKWRPLWRDSLAFDNTDLPEEVYLSGFARVTCGQAHEFHGLIAERDGQAVELAHDLFHRTGWKIRNVCCLQDLFVMPQMRGTGAGRALIEAVYAATDAAGAPDVSWLMAENNCTGRILYDRVGVKTPFIRYNRPA